MTDIAGSEARAQSVTLAECYPELTDALRGPLKVLDVRALSRASSEWPEIVESLTNAALTKAARPYIRMLVPTLDCVGRSPRNSQTTMPRSSGSRWSAVGEQESKRPRTQRPRRPGATSRRTSPAIVGGFVECRRQGRPGHHPTCSRARSGVHCRPCRPTGNNPLVPR